MYWRSMSHDVDCHRDEDEDLPPPPAQLATNYVPPLPPRNPTYPRHRMLSESSNIYSDPAIQLRKPMSYHGSPQLGASRRYSEVPLGHQTMGQTIRKYSDPPLPISPEHFGSVSSRMPGIERSNSFHHGMTETARRSYGTLPSRNRQARNCNIPDEAYRNVLPF